MATVITVHGTYAHSPSGTTLGDKTASTTTNPADLQWWQPGSSFEQDMRELVDATPSMGSGKLDVKCFEWNGENSESARREAGSRLREELRALEARKEPYCLVGHSHGGSVIGWALLESGAKRDKLDGLKRWITVGTPFVSLQKEHSLFSRLDLMRKVVFVASLMLLLMFLIDVIVQLFAAGNVAEGLDWLRRRGPQWGLTAVLMSLPIFLLYFVLKWFDARTLHHYRRSVKARALEFYGGRWLSLTHTDDEAVQGLAFLPGAKLNFFDKQFAISAITTLSVFALPFIYVFAVSSPPMMLNLADLIKTHLYPTKQVEAERELREVLSARDNWYQQFQAPRTRSPVAAPSRTGTPVTASPVVGRSAIQAPTEADRRATRTRYVELRKGLEAKHGDLQTTERSLRFKRRFFENRDGTPCEGGRLCGRGRDVRVNSRLLLYLVTNEVTSAVVGDNSKLFDRRSIWATLVPALLVPVVFGLIALLIMLIIRGLAHGISHVISRLLNAITNAEVKRAVFGNDTEGEIAVGAVDRPTWIERSPPRLPAQLGDAVTAYSNGVASNSLAKFRRAIGQLASQEPKHTADSAITTYFTWKELVHASYFDVPEFRRLVAQAVSRAEGFAPSPRFRGEPDYTRTAQWLAEIEGTPGTTAKPNAQPPTRDDAGAVSTVVASTVKVEP